MTDTTTVIRRVYGRIAREGGGCCAPECCGTGGGEPPRERPGYSADDRAAVPPGADLGLGCGNPLAHAALRPGETVLDLGSGAGFDCLLAARAVGTEGTVIGVDLTPEMVARARRNLRTAGAANVEVRLGDAARLPVADDSVDVIISNCVINLAPDKAAVFREAFRVLRPGGRLAIADIVATARLPEAVRRDPGLVAGCAGGAATAADLSRLLRDAGFKGVRIEPAADTGRAREHPAPRSGAPRTRFSATIEGRKPR